MSDIAERLRQKVRDEGFSAMGICGPDGIPHAAHHLAKFLGANYHGEMKWMERRQEWRRNPAALWPEAKSIIMLADSYAQEVNSLEQIQRKSEGTISVYARNRDYHDIIKKRLKRICRWLVREIPGSDVKVFVDTAPVMEKPLAQAAGIGWQGKHTNLVSRTLGSWFFLGAIFSTVDFPKDHPEEDHCGSCRRCLDICPTDAFPAPYRLDARKCISYLTIEHKGKVDEGLRKGIGNRIFGCDDCLAVCPWNKFAKEAGDAKYFARAELESPSLKSLVQLDDPSFRKLFRGSPVFRIGRNRFVRNVLYAIGNSGDASLLSAARSLKSDEDPVVADAARWAETQLRRAESRSPSGTDDVCPG